MLFLHLKCLLSGLSEDSLSNSRIPARSGISGVYTWFNPLPSTCFRSSGLRVEVRRLYKHLSNISQLALVTSVIGWVLQSLQQRPSVQGSTQMKLVAELALKILFCSLLYFIFNSTLVAMAVALVTVESLALVWKTEFLGVLPTNLLNTLPAAITFLSAAPLFYALALVLLPLVAGSYYSRRMKLAQQPAV